MTDWHPSMGPRRRDPWRIVECDFCSELLPWIMLLSHYYENHPVDEGERDRRLRRDRERARLARQRAKIAAKRIAEPVGTHATPVGTHATPVGTHPESVGTHPKNLGLEGETASGGAPRRAPELSPDPSNPNQIKVKSKRT